jgi:hypothetical protein
VLDNLALFCKLKRSDSDAVEARGFSQLAGAAAPAVTLSIQACPQVAGADGDHQDADLAADQDIGKVHHDPAGTRGLQSDRWKVQRPPPNPLREGTHLREPVKGRFAIPTGRPLTGPLRRKFRQLSGLREGWSEDRTTSGRGHIGGADPPGIADAKIRLEAATPVTHQLVELPGARY